MTHGGCKLFFREDWQIKEESVFGIKLVLYIGGGVGRSKMLYQALFPPSFSFIHQIFFPQFWDFIPWCSLLSLSLSGWLVMCYLSPGSPSGVHTYTQTWRHCPVPPPPSPRPQPKSVLCEENGSQLRGRARCAKWGWLDWQRMVRTDKEGDGRRVSHLNNSFGLWGTGVGRNDNYRIKKLRERQLKSRRERVRGEQVKDKRRQISKTEEGKSTRI